jgi:hypothetical protein
MPRLISIGIHAGSHRLGAFPDDGVGQYGGGGSTIARDIGSFRCDLAHHLRAHVFELVVKLDLFGNCDAVLGDARSAIGLVEQDIASLGAKCDTDGVSECIDAAQHSVACIDRESDFLGRHNIYSLWMILKMIAEPKTG